METITIQLPVRLVVIPSATNRPVELQITDGAITFEALDENAAVELNIPLTVRVLGPVAVEGATEPLPPKALELVAYLATHPAGVTEEQLRTGLWPNQVISRGRFNNLISDTRRRLGRSPTGEWWLDRTLHGQYRLTPGHRCDLAQVLDALTRPFEPTAAQAALGVVRGHPFSGWTTVEWIFDENFEAIAAQAVHVLTERAKAYARQHNDPVLGGLVLQTALAS